MSDKKRVYKIDYMDDVKEEFDYLYDPELNRNILTLENNRIVIIHKDGSRRILVNTQSTENLLDFSDLILLVLTDTQVKDKVKQEIRAWVSDEVSGFTLEPMGEILLPKNMVQRCINGLEQLLDVDESIILDEQINVEDLINRLKKAIDYCEAPCLWVTK